MTKQRMTLMRLGIGSARHFKVWMSVIGTALTYPMSNRDRRQRISEAFNASRAYLLPYVSLDQVVGRRIADSEVIQLKAVARHDHNCSIVELLVIGAVAKMVNPKRCFEIGTYDGRSALAMAVNIGKDAEVFTLNLPANYVEEHPEVRGKVDAMLSQKVRSGERAWPHPESSRIHQLWGDSRQFDFAPFAPSELIFIDGAHDEKSVTSDSLNALTIIDRRNGAILWHDATSYGVGRALPRLVQQGHRIHIIRGTDIGVLGFRDGREVEVWS